MNLLGKAEYLFYLSQSSVLLIYLNIHLPNGWLGWSWIPSWCVFGVVISQLWLFGIDFFVNISDLLILCLCHWYYWFDLGNLILIRKALIFVLFVVHIWIIILYYILLIIFHVSFNFSFGIILVINRSASVYQSWMWVLCIINMVFLLKITSRAFDWIASNHALLRILGRVHAFIFD